MPEKRGSPLCWAKGWLDETGLHLPDMPAELFDWWSDWLGEYLAGLGG